MLRWKIFLLTLESDFRLRVRTKLPIPVCCKYFKEKRPNDRDVNTKSELQEKMLFLDLPTLCYSKVQGLGSILRVFLFPKGWFSLETES